MNDMKDAMETLTQDENRINEETYKMRIKITQLDMERESLQI